MTKETILSKSYEFLKEMIPVISRFPRSQRFLTGDRVQTLINDVMELFIEAYYTDRQAKKQLLLKVNIQLEKLRCYNRLCYELGYYGSGKYKHITEKINELGRMNGGWLKSLK